MQPVANTKTDAQGHYKFDNPGAGRRAHASSRRLPGRELSRAHDARERRRRMCKCSSRPTRRVPSAVTAHAIILQPDGSDLDVGEEYNITNKTQPPLAYYKADGSFIFSLPEGAR